MMKRDECFEVLARYHTNEIVVATYKGASDWVAIKDGPFNYTSIGAMGQASSHGLGLAIGRPDRRILVLDGDGSLLMNLGSMATIASVAPKNYVHFVCENGTYETNGGQPIPGAGTISFSGIARAAGYRTVYEFSELSDFEANIGHILTEEGPVLVDLKMEPGVPYPQNLSDLYSAERRRAFKEALQGS
jgi:sulfopyruvate decarboxylase subunit beta